MKALLALLAALLIGGIAVARYVWFGFDVVRAITGCKYSATVLPTPPELRRLQLRLSRGAELAETTDDGERCAPLLRRATQGVPRDSDSLYDLPRRAGQLEDGPVFHIESRVLVSGEGIEASFGGSNPRRFLIVADRNGNRWYVPEDSHAFEFTDDHGDTCDLERRHAYNGALCSKTADVRYLPPDEEGPLPDQCTNPAYMSTGNDSPVVSRVSAPLKRGEVEVIASLDAPAVVDTDALLEGTGYVVRCVFQLTSAEEVSRLAIHTNIELAPTGSLTRLDTSVESGAAITTWSRAATTGLATCMRKDLGERDFGCITTDQIRHIAVTYTLQPPSENRDDDSPE